MMLSDPLKNLTYIILVFKTKFLINTIKTPENGLIMKIAWRIRSIWQKYEILDKKLRF